MRQALIVAGPTASGKSALGLEIAARIGGAIVNADAMQTYRAFPVLTAQPTAAERAQAPHALYGTLSLAERLTAARWRDMALAEIALAHDARRRPILVGGSGLYLRALTDGMASIPEVSAELRGQASVEWERLGPEAFKAQLARHDRATAERLRPNDRQRHVRAWAVWLATGRPLSSWQAEPDGGPPAGWRFRTILLSPPREWLRARIEARFDAMMAAGALEEVCAAWQAVRGGQLAADLPGLKAHGVPELFRHLDGAISLADARGLTIDHVRQYAKRQMTWFRHQIVPDLVVDPQDSQDRLSVAQFLDKTLD